MIIKLKKRNKFILRISLGVAVALCLAVFSFLLLYMNSRSADTISHVGGLYMQGMSKQIALHFENTIESQLKQVKALVNVIPGENDFSDEVKISHISSHARSFGFRYLALMDAEGRFKMIYGEQLSLADPAPFINSLNSGEDKIALGKDSSNNRVALLGATAAYNMDDGKQSVALVAAVSVDYITEVLSLDASNDRGYSFIISENGDYVVRSQNAANDNYFDRVLAVYDELNGMTKEEYLEELKLAMHNGDSYFGDMMSGGERKHLYATKLSRSEWYLLTLMPYGDIDQSIDQLSRAWLLASTICCALILCILLLIFIAYSKMLGRQMTELQTARDDAENSRKQAEHANRAKSEFLSNMSHDIRTPMNAIVGMTAIAESNLDDPKQIENCLKKISLSSKHLLGLINDILDMSKIENGKMQLNNEKVSLREVMDSIVNIVQPQIKMKNQKFDVLIHDVFVENVYCDSIRLNQVILNFLSNAIKFTPENGSIQIALYEEPSEKGEDFVRIHLSVKDNGIGMSPEFKERIFESFVREDNTRVNKTEGTGLGMAITKYIIEAMGGTIEIESEQGKGSEFKVTVDFEKAEIQEEDMTLPGWNMLVVDDDKRLCESVIDSLRSMGVNADWTLDGESAVKMMQKKHDEGSDYQIVLLDWQLPGIDGVETARQIHRLLGNDVPVLLISAYDCTEMEKDAENAGIRGFLSKPLFKSTLYYGLRKFTEMSETVSDKAASADVDFTGKRILLAEDNEINREIAAELLSELGFELDCAEDGQVCFDKFCMSKVGYYDAVLMDIRMPVMNGYDATAAIKTLNREDAKTIPIIAMTADAFAEDVKKCLDCGMCAHIAKPISIKEMAKVLRKFMK